MYEKGETLFQPIQSKSALKNIAIQYQIKGLNRYDPESFCLTLLQTLRSKQNKLKLN